MYMYTVVTAMSTTLDQWNKIVCDIHVHLNAHVHVRMYVRRTCTIILRFATLLTQH